MKVHRTKLGFASALLTVLIAASFLASRPANAEEESTTVIHLTARSFAFEPEVIQVNRGDQVVIELESLDAMHGIYLDGYELSVEAEPGHPARLAFTADKSGSFRFRCSVACGNLHPFMIGQLKVGPNLPFQWAMIALGTVALGAVWYLGKKHG